MLKPSTALALALSTPLLAGCFVGDRLEGVGRAPAFSRIGDPQDKATYQPVNLPMPDLRQDPHKPNSLWQAGARGFFKDQRANKVGDVMTVLVTINDQATVQNETERKRDNAENAGATNFLGLESKLGKIFPKAVDPANLVNANSKSDSHGTGTINRQDQVKLQLAALITQVLPNGNFVIQGSQEVLVNFEMRNLVVRGVVRPEDIQNDNTISYEKIAEARIAYGGKGQITDVQQPRYGQQLYDILFPF